MNSIFAVSNRWYKLRKAGGEKQKFGSNLFVMNWRKLPAGLFMVICISSSKAPHWNLLKDLVPGVLINKIEHAFLPK